MQGKTSYVSRETTKHAAAQLFAWEAYEKGVDVHLLAEPTKLELLQKEYEKKKDQFKSQVQASVLEKYGGEEHLQVPPKTLLLAQTEDYVEYSRSGKVIKGKEREVIKSKYEEDVYVNNHTSVWGSYWHGGQWGYKCCHSFVKNSYCLGEAGKTVQASIPPPEVQEVKKSSSESSSEEENEEAKKKAHKKNKKKDKKKKSKEKKKAVQSDEDKLKKALKDEEQSRMEADRLLALDERKRPYNSMFEAKKPSEEEIEAYYLKRRRDEDPMNQFMN